LRPIPLRDVTVLKTSRSAMALRAAFRWRNDDSAEPRKLSKSHPRLPFGAPGFPIG
jgi:hypothetical protein